MVTPLRRNDHDVTNTVNTTEPQEVHGEISQIFQDLYPSESTAALDHSFLDMSRIFKGEHPRFHACDTAYHDLQHTLDVTLAMARLMNGYERSRDHTEPIGSRRFALGVVTALFHDVGYIRRRHDTRNLSGAVYTLRHVSRGSAFLSEYLVELGMPDLAPVAAQLIHFTGYEIPVREIKLPNLMFRMIGNMLGTADIVAQMSDRCYLEKCRDRLFPEFVLGGLAASKRSDPGKNVLFFSAHELVQKTPKFFQFANVRLRDHLGSSVDFAEKHFGGQNLYVDEINKNVRYAEHIADRLDLELLRRTPPVNPGSSVVKLY
jgi:hypothetical protein